MIEEYYVIENTVREGICPGTIVSIHGSHWEAVKEMLWLNDTPDPVEEYPDPRAYPLADNH